MSSQGKVRFGVFELDLGTGELRKSGTRLRLQEQPFQVLKALVERPGEVVTREELQRRLWPDDTFVDFEDGLSTSVKKIRRALGDSAANPRFVETLPKRGYRFIAPVNGGGETPGRRRAVWPWLAVAGGVTAAVLLLVNSGSEPAAVPWPVPLTSDPGREMTPEFSPDGNQVVYAASGEEEDDLDLYIKAIGPGEAVPLTDDPGDDFGPAWSPDGRWIAFTRWRKLGGLAEIMVIPALGGRERKLGEFGFNPDLLWPFLAWTSDSKWIIFPDRSEDWRSGGGLSFLSLETGETVPLTTAGNQTSKAPTHDLFPAVSPDGEWVAFGRGFSGYNIYKVRISSAPARAGEPQLLTRSDSSAYRFGPCWTPDGSEIVYWQVAGAGPDGLWRMDASGRGEPTPMNIGGTNPAVSAPARRLAYERRQRRSDIWRVALDAPGHAGGRPERWIASTYADTWPSYSPDGEKIVFRSTRSGFDEIWIANSDGSQPAQLTSLRDGQSGTPRWSPDGRRLLFNSMTLGPNREVFIMGAEGGKIRRLTQHPANDYLPSWSADGRWVYFTSTRTGRPEVWKIPAGGGEAVQVTRGGGASGFESSDGAFHYYVRERSLWKVPSSGGEESIVPGPTGMSTHAWTLVDTGVYFVPFTPRLKGAIRYFDFATGKLDTIVTLDGDPGQGISVAPDKQSLLFTEGREHEIDLMLVEGFE